MDDNPKRNHIGDIDLNLGKYDWQESRKNRYTYVFKFYDEKVQHYMPHFNLHSKSAQRLTKAAQDPEYFQLKLYKSPTLPPFDFYIQTNNHQLSLLVSFFKEVFQEKSFYEGYLRGHQYYSLILPKTKYLEIINFINYYELLPIRDLIFELIAIAQHIYTEKIAFWERPEMQKLVTSAEKETTKAIRVIEKLDIHNMGKAPDRGIPNSKLLKINFVFNNETIVLEHEWLAKEFVRHFRDYYDGLLYKNWRLDLSRYPDRFKEDKEKQQFKYKLALSFYNMLTQTGLYKLIGEVKTPNKLMECIAGLLEFSLIKVADDAAPESDKIRTVRNWIKRNKIKPMLTQAKVPHNAIRLLRYFEADFIELGEEIKKADILSIAGYIAKRFNLEPLIADFSHLAQCLKQIRWLLRSDFSVNKSVQDKRLEEFENFKKLFISLQQGTSITSLSYKLEGQDDEYKLEQRLPLYLIEEALKCYAEAQKVEIDSDLLQTSVKRSENGSFSIRQKLHFSLPHQRFAVRFVRSLYDYLLAEAPPAEFDYLPSLRYYSIIATLLIRSDFFYTQNIDENFAVEKVKQWHRLSLSS